MLADTSASHEYISESFVTRHGLEVIKMPVSLKLANNGKAIASGVCKVPLNIQSYIGIVECYVLPMHTDFDLILGDRWCTNDGADATYTEHYLRIKHSDSDGTVRRLQVHSKPIERTEFQCSLIDKSEVADAMRKGDCVFIVNVTTIHDNDYVRCNSLQANSADASTVIESLPQDMQSVVKEHSDVFPYKLPNGLPPTGSVFHTINLKPGSTPPPQRVCRLSRAELKEVNRQVSHLLEKGYIHQVLAHMVLVFCLLPRNQASCVCV